VVARNRGFSEVLAETSGCSGPEPGTDPGVIDALWSAGALRVAACEHGELDVGQRVPEVGDPRCSCFDHPVAAEFVHP
jgi:hypothetical protein